MIRMIASRVLAAIPTLFVIIALAFVLMRLAPGGPFDQERALTPEIEANIRAAYHLDEPLPRQFLRYVGGVLHGDFGPSFKYRDFAVADLIGSGLPVSLQLGAGALLLALAGGIALGTLAALRPHGWTDVLVSSLALTGLVVPSFVMAPMLALVFGVVLGWLPVAGWNDGALANRVLPTVALALPTLAVIARLTRSGLLETLNSNYVRTARAKGLTAGAIVLHHAMQPALMPVVSYLGPAAAGLLTGSVVIETVFGLPGIGRYFVLGALNRDYTLVMGVVVLYGALLILFNLVVDLAYGWLDPKLRRS